MSNLFIYLFIHLFIYLFIPSDIPQAPQTSTFGTFAPDYSENLKSSTVSGLVISREDIERNTDTFVGKALEEDPYDEVVVDPPMQETERAANENEEEEMAKVKVIDNDPKAVGARERENVYDEIVNVDRIPEATSMEGLGEFVYYYNTIKELPKIV